MKAIVYTKYGPPDVLHLDEVEKPTPKDSEILIKVHAASINYYDWRHLRPDPFFIRFMGGGLLKPKHLVFSEANKDVKYSVSIMRVVLISKLLYLMI